MDKAYEPTKEVQEINDAHGYGIYKGKTQDDYDRWQLELLYHHLPGLSGSDKARAEQTIRKLQKRVATRRADEIDLDPLVTAKACVERLKARTLSQSWRDSERSRRQRE